MTKPTFTVVVPTYKRSAKLANCLESLAQQTLPASDYEVIVVDDAGTRSAVEDVVRRVRGVSSRCLHQNHRGPAAARNLGASFAEGDYLAFTDDDCCPAPTWLETLRHHFRRNADSPLVGGKVINVLTDDPFASASQALVDYLIACLNRDPARASMLTSNNFCVAAGPFRAFGGFDTAFTGAGGEDREFCLRWIHAGHRLVYAADAIVYHAHDMTFLKFVRQHLAYGRGAAILRRRAIEAGYGPLPVEPSSFYTNLFGYPLGTPGIRNPLLCTALFAFSQAANAAGYFHARLNERAT